MHTHLHLFYPLLYKNRLVYWNGQADMPSSSAESSLPPKESTSNSKAAEKTLDTWFLEGAKKVGDVAKRAIDTGLAHAEEALNTGKNGIDVMEHGEANTYADRTEACMQDPSKKSDLINFYLLLEKLYKNYKKGDSLEAAKTINEQLLHLGVPSCSSLKINALGYQILGNRYDMDLDKDAVCGPKTIEGLIYTLTTCLDQSSPGWRMEMYGRLIEGAEGTLKNNVENIADRRRAEADYKHNKKLFDQEEAFHIMKELVSIQGGSLSAETVKNLERGLGQSLTENDKERILEAAILFKGIWGTEPNIGEMIIRVQEGDSNLLLPEDRNRAKKRGLEIDANGEFIFLLELTDQDKERIFKAFISEETTDIHEETDLDWEVIQDIVTDRELDINNDGDLLILKSIYKKRATQEA